MQTWRTPTRHIRQNVVLWLASLVLLAGFAVAPSARAVSSGVINVRCPALSHHTADDPIVFPGLPGASHLHSFAGNTTTSATSTFESMRAGGTTCQLSFDASGYWVPSLLHNGAVVEGKANIYYRGAGVQAFPPNFKIVAGYPTVGTGTPVLGWNCGDATLPLEPLIPDCGSGNIHAHIFFPSCWDGVSLDSVDHRSHMAYTSSLPNKGSCPETHPVQLPRLRISISYEVSSNTDLVLSSDVMVGTPPGASLHADFWNTWEQSAFEALVDRCLNGGVQCVAVNDENFTSYTT